MNPESSQNIPTRRKGQRLPLILAVEMSSDEKRGRCGVTRNASGKGLLIVTPSRFPVGERLELAVHVPGRAEVVAGRVVRIEENGKASAEMWRYSLAVELDGALPDDLLETAQARSSRSA